MLANNTGYQHFPLSAAGGGDNPTLAQGSPTVFNLNSIPTFQGGMAYYVPALIVTILGNIVQGGGTGVRFAWQNLFRFLVESLEVRNTFFGSMMSPQHVKGSMLPIIEQVSTGYRTGFRKRGFFAAANGTTGFSFSFLVPLSSGLGQKPHHTAPLAIFLKEAQLSLQVAQNTVLSTVSPGGTITSLSARCSAILYPDTEIRVGPLVEWIDYQIAAASGQVVVPIQSFGRNTQLTKSDGTSAGLLYFGVLTNVQGLPGAYAAENITRINVPWRGQTDTGHIPPFLAQQILAMGSQRVIGGAVDQGAAQALSDTAGFPYIEAIDFSNAQQEMANLGAVPIVVPTVDLEVSKVQVVGGDESISIQASSGPSGTHHMLAQHLRSLPPATLQECAELAITSGLAAKVLGTVSGLKWEPKLLKHNQDIAVKKARFLPVVLKRTVKDSRPVTAGGTRMRIGA